MWASRLRPGCAGIVLTLGCVVGDNPPGVGPTPDAKPQLDAGQGDGGNGWDDRAPYEVGGDKPGPDVGGDTTPAAPGAACAPGLPLGLKVSIWPPEAFTGGESVTVTGASIDFLSATRAGGAGTVGFTWNGPSLTTWFAPGDTVTLGASAGWQWIEGGRARAAIYVGSDYYAPTTLPGPPGGPSIGFYPSCVQWESLPSCVAGRWLWMDDLSVPFGGFAISVAPGESKDFGPYVVTNAESHEAGPVMGPACAVEGGWHALITVLIPTALPDGGLD